jgi:hypothetical protein
MNKCLAVGSVILVALAVTRPLGAETATSLKSFGGVEEPEVVFHVKTGTFSNDDFVNITEVGGGRFRMTLRYHDGDWWDGDRENQSKDRQRAEVKVLGPRQKPGETFEYRSTWKLDPNFNVGARFCHITQVKGYGGPDTGTPLVTTSIMKNTEAAVRYCSSEMRMMAVVRPFSCAPNAPKTVAYRLTTSSANGTADGGLVVSVDGDGFTGIQKVRMYRRDAPQYQPKWGLYRGIGPGLPFTEDWVEHSDVRANRMVK